MELFFGSVGTAMELRTARWVLLVWLAVVFLVMWGKWLSLSPEERAEYESVPVGEERASDEQMEEWMRGIRDRMERIRSEQDA